MERVATLIAIKLVLLLLLNYHLLLGYVINQIKCQSN